MAEAIEAGSHHDPAPLASIARERPATALALALIRFYQLTVSRMLPVNTCRFYPTCSHYGYEAIEKYGIFKGGWLAFTRILRCQPFFPGGYDPVP
ncbi:MAG: membrane protein insertion efficiency factor YidD [Chloroflexi bacterium]|nr:membrane protein insertion efficiency factor YidD [Chloroflexota bacterium]MBI3763467.1 membrane protein insertion efficiency factor YidD [Chloroflexota bacterium]